MVKHVWWFAIVTFLVGWVVQLFFLSFLSIGVASPQILFLATMAIGVRGRIHLAETLGFFWGLCLDAHGLTLFGSQGFLMALAGYGTGHLSRQLNEEKLITQETLAVAGSVIYGLGLIVLDHLFRAPPAPRPFPMTTLLLVTAMNALAVPPVFWAMRQWSRLWTMLEGVPAHYV